MKKICSKPFFSHWYMTLRLGGEEICLFHGSPHKQSKTLWFSVVFSGNSFLGCLLVHLGKKIASALFASS